MSQLEVDKIIPQSGTTLTIGDSGDTISFADGATLAIDTNTLAIDSTNNRVGIGTTSPSYPLVVSGGGSLSNNDTSIGLDISGTNHIRQRITTPTSGGYQASLALESNSNEVVISTAGSNEIRFTTNASEAMRIDSSGNVGIGNTTPSSFVESSRFVVGSGTSGVNEMMFLYSGTNTFGALGFADGTSSTDRYRGMIGYDHITDAMFISTAGGGSASRDVTIDSSGNVGIGVVPQTWYTQLNALQIGLAGSLAGNTTNPSRTYLSANAYLNASNQETYIATDEASQYFQNAGTHIFKVAPSGTAGTAISFTEAMKIDNSGNVGIGTSSPSKELHVYASSGESAIQVETAGTDAGLNLIAERASASFINFGDQDSTNVGQIYYPHSGNYMHFKTNGSERMRIDSSGFLLVGTTDNTPYNNTGTNSGFVVWDNGRFFTAVSSDFHIINRTSSDGALINFAQDGTSEGNISVSGATVSYNGFTGTHWSRLADNSKPTILKGTILESLDEMMNWYQVQFDVTDEEGNIITKKESYALGDGESVGDVITYNFEGTDYQATIIQEGDVKHTKSKVSNTVDAKNVYGVFVDWDNDDDTVNDMYVAQTGTFVIRMNSAETVSKGDLIQSNGDGTGKVQTDDIIRASTVAKVLSTTKIETYEDGSYIVPCSLHC